MKNINKKIALAIIGAAAVFSRCKEPFDMTPVPNTTSSNFSADFLLINASPDAPSLDFYVNNLKVGSSVPADSAQATYTAVPITSNGVFANTNIRAKATSGTIGGVLGGSDLIFRATNTSTNNFQASNLGFYTLIVVDTLNRPIPIRTLDAGNFGNTTYYSSRSSFTGKDLAGGDSTINLTIGSNNSIVTANIVKRLNGGTFPSFFVPIGLVPLGSSDVGGPRFLLLTDALPAAGSTTTGKFAARFINASPDAGAVTATVNGVSLSGSLTYPLTQANFNPTVGSRSATIAFANNVTTAGTYKVIVKIGSTTITSGAFAFKDQGVYTIVLAGSLAKNTLRVTIATNK